MRAKCGDSRCGIRYSEAFKLAIVKELQEQNRSFNEMKRKYGIKGCATIQGWVRKYGNGTRGKVIRVQKPEEIDELAQLKRRIRQLEAVVADAQVDLAIERATSRLLAQKAGVENLEEFKKKVAGP